MKKTSKILVIALAIALLVTAFTACSSSSSDTSDLSSIGTLNEGKIIFGTNPEFPPFEYVDTEDAVAAGEDGVVQYAGIDMEIAQAIADDNGVTCEIANLEFDSLLMALQNGQLDCCIAGMTVTEERMKSVDFTEPYYVATQVMIVPEDSDITCAADIADKKIVVVQGYTGQTCMEELGYEFEAFKKGTEAVMEVANGKADVFVIDSATAAKYLADNPGLKIVEDSEVFADEEYAIAVKKGNTVLLNILNDGIAKLQEEGKIAEWGDQYQ